MDGKGNSLMGAPRLKAPALGLLGKASRGQDPLSSSEHTCLAARVVGVESFLSFPPHRLPRPPLRFFPTTALPDMCSFNPTPVLPAELMDKIVDAIAFDEDIDTLRSCLLVSAAFRLRALCNMISRLDFSPDYGREHLVKAQGLLQLIETTPALAPMPQCIAFDMSEWTTGLWADLATRVLDLLPRLPRLDNLTLSNIDAHAARSLAGTLAPLSAVSALRLENCDFAAEDLDAILRCFPAMRSLDLVQCNVDLPESYVPAALPFSGAVCELAMTATPSSIAWAQEHRDTFALASLATVPSIAAHDLVAEHADEVRSLAVCVDESTCKAGMSKRVATIHFRPLITLLTDEEVAAASVAKCSQLSELQVIAPSAPRALLLFRSVIVVAPTCQNVDLFLDGGYACQADLDEMRDVFSRPVWAKVDMITVNGDVLDLTPPTQPKPDLDPSHVPLPASPTLKPFEADDVPGLDSLDETESVADSDSDLVTPALSEASSDTEETSDGEDEYVPVVSARLNPYAPPFALGNSIAKPRGVDEQGISQVESPIVEALATNTMQH